MPDASGSTTTLVNVTEQSPYPWAEGGAISSARDLHTLIVALLGGRRVLVYAFSPTGESVNTGPFILGIAKAALRSERFAQSALH
ncbi:hypothetical protein KGA66_05855 [Actinocrinis puniceicyclus]|uniref:Uncharacterized protein n=1 Tax=Actinocrinis puniceicyclus TaxID=977794 RepID=A0A8J7WLY5_9ACTN|nr:hypothetical protein [Actinocrinis puniceicyclus]MBS2962562.1 hypothetical protein [Actinocrinis puniceicyclus]